MWCPSSTSVHSIRECIWVICASSTHLYLKRACVNNCVRLTRVPLLHLAGQDFTDTCSRSCDISDLLVIM